MLDPPSYSRPRKAYFALCTALGGALLLSANLVYANDVTPYSSTLSGPLGLNTQPSARLAKTGAVTLGIGTLDPYIHSYLGFQIAKPLYINIRQSAEISDLNDDAKRLYPGVDLKLRLIEENRSRPAIAIGLQSAIGHKRMAGEYIALSKRYHDFDFTAGLGWGRHAGAGHFNNPLKGLSSHFGKQRPADGEMPNEPSDWFTGEKIGLFGGIEYFTPIDNLSLKFDWGADRYSAEQAAFDFDAPAPWSLGLAYQPTTWANLSLAMQGTDKIMGRVSLNGLLQNWKKQDADYKKDKTQTPFRPYRTGLAIPGQMEISAAREDVLISDTRATIYDAQTRLALNPYEPTPEQLGRAIKHIANHAGPAIETIEITPTVMGLHGPTVSLLRSDFENAAARHRGSPEEIWQNTEFITDGQKPFTKLPRARETFMGLDVAELSLNNQISLSEEDSGALYRSSILAGVRGPKLFGLLDHGYALRLNIKDNLNHLRDIRPAAILPVRSDVDAFADRRLALDTSYLALTHSFKSDLHLSLIGGYLEEMYAGAGGELLYRPFGSRFTLGAESWLAFKRDPYSSLNAGFAGDHLLTGHINAWYDLPHHEVTFGAKVGRFLAEDIGGQLSLSKKFDNGAELEGFVTITDQADYDPFGGTTHAYNGVRLSLPLGGFKHLPSAAKLHTKIEPFGRDTGQSIEKPLALYELTEPFSYTHMQNHWDGVVP